MSGITLTQKEQEFEAFKAMKFLRGVKVWFEKKSGGTGIEYFVQEMELPEYINADTLVSYEPLTREKRKKVRKVLEMKLKELHRKK